MTPEMTKLGLRYRCDNCWQKFRTREEANSHLIHDHWGIPKGWGCPICDKK